MTFTNSVFLFFMLPTITIVVYLLGVKREESSKSKGQLITILIADLLFYLWGGSQAFIYTVLICFELWLICNLMIKWNNIRVLVIGIILILMPMISIRVFMGTGIVVPIGLSFYTFQSLSVLADIHRGKIKKCPSLFECFCYIFFFASVQSGPIIRYDVFEKGLYNAVDRSYLNSGVRRFAVGLIKKMLVADKIAPLADFYFDGVSKGQHFSVIGLWIGSIAFSLQLYFDFSGYSDMAIGIACIFGFDVPENFDHPYEATSIQNFWKKWHISLSSWFKDYVYIPMGGSRRGDMIQVRNLFVVWMLTSLWHGFDLTFFIWGMGHCILLLIERYSKHRYERNRFISHLYVLFSVNLLWVPFRCDSISTLCSYLKGMIGVGEETVTLWLEHKPLTFIPILLLAVFGCFWGDKIMRMTKEHRIFRYVYDLGLCGMTVLAICAVINGSYYPNLYGKF